MYVIAERLDYCSADVIFVFLNSVKYALAFYDNDNENDEIGLVISCDTHAFSQMAVDRRQEKYAKII